MRGIVKVLDMHCDTLFELNGARKIGHEKSFFNNDLHIDLQKLQKGDYFLQCFAAYVDLASTKNPLVSALEEIDIFYQIINTYPDQIAQVKTYQDILENQKTRKISAMLTMEEGGCCLGNLSVLRMYYELGVRMMTLTWNYENELAYPNFIPHSKGDIFPCRANTENGLKEKGIEFLKEMEQLNMIVDVSHLSDAGFWDVVSHTHRPFIASHSNARTLSPHVRNLSDEMLHTLGDRGGLLGINYCAAFLDNKENEIECQSNVSIMAEHILYIKNLAGLDIIALGSDFDGISCELEMKDASYLPLLEQELIKRGFHESEIEKIFYKNAMRLFKELL